MGAVPAGQGATPRRVFLECTSTYASRYNTGIQRAVRNLINASAAVKTPPCTAVIYNGRYLEPIGSLAVERAHATRRASRASLIDVLRWMFHRVRSGIVRILPSESMRNAMFSQRLEYALRRCVYAVQNLRRWAISFRTAVHPPTDFRRGDVLVLLDSTWNVDLSRELSRAKAAGVEIWAVVNDLIPLQHPDLAPEGSPVVFDYWLRRTVPYLHGLLGISRSVADATRAHLLTSGIVNQPPRVEYFYLGAGFEIENQERDPGTLTAVDAAFRDATGGVYLTVGTIEPRKGHSLMLDAFDALWSRGTDARLVIFGRLGWRSDALAQRIRAHPEYTRRLLWFDAGSDIELSLVGDGATAGS
ncbi:MAG: hypothetical protein ABI981_05135, partial [Betaproteobacteria bacterium]